MYYNERMSTPHKYDLCRYGHALTPENTVASAHRPCKLCALYAGRAFRLGITLAVYVQNEAELNAAFYPTPRHPRLDWSLPQRCAKCSREMHRSGPAQEAGDTRIKYGGKGLCATCYGIERAAGKRLNTPELPES